MTGGWQERERRLQETLTEARGLAPEPGSRAVRLGVGALALAWLLVVAWAATVLPDPAPTHWDLRGRPDGWSSRWVALAAMAVAPATGVACLPLSRLVLGAPHLLSLPGADLQWWTATPSRVRRLERLLRDDLWRLLGWLLALEVPLAVGTTRASRRPGGVDDAAWPELTYAAVMLLVLLGWTWWSAVRRYRPDPTVDGPA